MSEEFESFKNTLQEFIDALPEECKNLNYIVLNCISILKN